MFWMLRLLEMLKPTYAVFSPFLERPIDLVLFVFLENNHNNQHNRNFLKAMPIVQKLQFGSRKKNVTLLNKQIVALKFSIGDLLAIGRCNRLNNDFLR